MKGFNFFIFLLIFVLQVNSQAPEDTSTSATSSTTSSTSSSSTTSSVETSVTSSSTTSSTTSSSTSSATTPPTSPPTNSPTTTPSANAPTSTPSLTPTVVVSSIDGVAVTTTVTSPVDTSSPSPSSSGKPAGQDNSSDDSGLGTGSIVGLSVAGGVAVIGIIAFFVWKFTRKRFSDFDDNEAIKWPDLNTHGAGTGGDSHPLPVKNTGRSGFDTGSEGSLSRVPSTNYSTPDFNNGVVNDPYAVPPLPHLNPNQPYRDDPGAAYYDPYRGPVPGTIEHGGPGWTGEAIPMNMMNASGRMSPGPHVAYGAEPAYEYDLGSQSPAPGAGYGGRTSPGPQAAYGGRASPGPRAVYGGASTPVPGYEAYSGR